VERAAEWRGSPTASTKNEFFRVLKFLNPSKQDVFLDLGCGYGRPCIWIAPKVKQAIGIESHYFRYKHAERDVESSGSTNVRILWDDLGNVSYRDATIIYSVIYVGFDIIKKIQFETNPGTQIVLYGLPPYPLRSEKLFGNFRLLRTPFDRVADEDEFARIHAGRNSSTMKKLIRSLDHDQARDLKREIRDSEVNWRSLAKK
jgi:SAM-dependent methyltransferase